MYTAILVVCAVLGQGHDGHCFELRDNWGPYQNMSICKKRTEEMRKESVSIFKDYEFPYKPIAWRCDYDDSGAA